MATTSKKQLGNSSGKQTQERLTLGLYQAIENKDLEEVERILATGLSPNVSPPDAYFGSPLHMACCQWGGVSLDIVKALVAAGADVDLQDYGNGETPLHYAVDVDCEDGWQIVRYLVQIGAKADICNRDGLIPAELAENLGHEDAVIAMLDAGMPVETQGSCGTLFWYFAYDSYSLVVELANRGADMEAPDKWFGHTPLARACEALGEGEVGEIEVDNPSWQIFRFLLDRGVDRTCKKFGRFCPPRLGDLIEMYKAQKLSSELFDEIADPGRCSKKPDFYSPSKK
jgi:ankyrin repeat protein